MVFFYFFVWAKIHITFCDSLSPNRLSLILSRMCRLCPIKKKSFLPFESICLVENWISVGKKISFDRRKIDKNSRKKISLIGPFSSRWQNEKLGRINFWRRRKNEKKKAEFLRRNFTPFSCQIYLLNDNKITFWAKEF